MLSHPIQIAIFEALMRRLKSSKRRLVKIQSNNIVKVDMEDQSDDFKLLDTNQSPNVYNADIKPFEVDEPFGKKYSTHLLQVCWLIPMPLIPELHFTAYDEIVYILLRKEQEYNNNVNIFE